MYCQIPTNHRVKIESEVYPFTCANEPTILVCASCLKELESLPEVTKPVNNFLVLFTQEDNIRQHQKNKQAGNEQRAKVRELLSDGRKVTRVEIALHLDCNLNRASEIIGSMVEVISEKRDGIVGKGNGKNCYYIKQPVGFNQSMRDGL